MSNTTKDVEHVCAQHEASAAVDGCVCRQTGWDEGGFVYGIPESLACLLSCHHLLGPALFILRYMWPRSALLYPPGQGGRGKCSFFLHWMFTESYEPMSCESPYLGPPAETNLYLICTLVHLTKLAATYYRQYSDEQRRVSLSLFEERLAFSFHLCLGILLCLQPPFALDLKAAVCRARRCLNVICTYVCTTRQKRAVLHQYM